MAAEESIVKFLTGKTAKGRERYNEKLSAGEVNGAIFFDLYNRQVVVEGKTLNNNVNVIVSNDPETGAEITTYEFDTVDGRKVTLQNARKNGELKATDIDFSAICDFKGGLLSAEQMAMLNQISNDMGYKVVKKEVNGETYWGFEKSVINTQTMPFWESLDD